MADGGEVVLDWHWTQLSGGPRPTAWDADPDLAFDRPADEERAPIVLILHGISGGSHEVNVRIFAEEVATKGWRAVVYNGRGCTVDRPLATPKVYLYGDTDDLREKSCGSSRADTRMPRFLASGFRLVPISYASSLARQARARRFYAPSRSAMRST
jgi:predicted alpha/beta-fold hydrolase